MKKIKILPEKYWVFYIGLLYSNDAWNPKQGSTKKYFSKDNCIWFLAKMWKNCEFLLYYCWRSWSILHQKLSEMLNMFQYKYIGFLWLFHTYCKKIQIYSKFKHIQNGFTVELKVLLDHFFWVSSGCSKGALFRQWASWLRVTCPWRNMITKFTCHNP